MKHKFIYLLLIGILFASCEKENTNLFEQSPDSRLKEKIEEYYTTLSENKQGWLLSVNTGAVGGFNHWVNFNQNNRVTMLSDVEQHLLQYKNSATEAKESNYIFKASQNISLLFDTYSYLHILSDPQGNVNGGKNGEGLKSDFEFTIIDKTDQTYALEGRYFKTKAFLTPCTSEQSQAIQNGGLLNIHENIQKTLAPIKYPVIEYENQRVGLELSSRQVSASYLDSKNEIQEVSVGLFPRLESITNAQSISNLKLFDALDINGAKLTDFKYENGKYYALINNQKTVVFDNKKPIIPLRFGYQKDFSKLKVEPSKLVGTIQEPFLTDIFNAAKKDFLAKWPGYTLSYLYPAFVLLNGKEVMQLSCVYTYKNSLYSVLWIYEFIRNSDGTITFTNRTQKNAGAYLYEPQLRVITDYFCSVIYSKYDIKTSGDAQNPAGKVVIDRIIPKTFRIDWVENNTPELDVKLGGFFPIDNPKNFCPGELIK